MKKIPSEIKLLYERLRRFEAKCKWLAATAKEETIEAKKELIKERRIRIMEVVKGGGKGSSPLVNNLKAV